MNSKFIQDNIIYILIPIIVIALGAYFSVTKVTEMLQKADALEQKEQEQQNTLKQVGGKK